MPSVLYRHPTPTSSHFVPNPHIMPVLRRLLIGRLVVLLILVCVSFAQETTVDSIDPAHLRARAEAGHAPEQIKLGRALRFGIGVKQNPVEAVHWFLKAADQGDPEAQTDLGYMYALGLGVKQSPEQAFRWFQRAALGNYALAQNNVAVLLAAGVGTRQDRSEAINWWTRAAKNGLAVAQVNLALNLLTQGDLAEKEQGVHWLKQAAKQKDVHGEFWLGTLYHFGKGVTQNSKLAAEWYRKAAERGYSRAQNNLAKCYSSGTGVERDLGQAVKWYKLAAAQGNGMAMRNLANLFAGPENAEPNYPDAYLWALIALRNSSGDDLREMQSLVDQLRPRLSPGQAVKAEAAAEEWIAQHPFSPEEFAGYPSADLEKLFPEKFAHKP